MKPILSLAMMLMATLLLAQSPVSYTNDRDESHLCGPVKIADLENHGPWYAESLENWKPSVVSTKWAKELKNTEVEIYLGTWCGDSKNWVPKFVDLWNELGLLQDQLQFICLYDTEEKYKQGPNGEEVGLNIHRVPTFIFKEGGEEYARIVEFPVTTLEQDLEAIAAGYPQEPNYRAATYFQNLLDTTTTEKAYENANGHFRNIYKKVTRSSELNTLGYVYLRSGRMSEALMAFHFNTYLFRYEPNVYDSYAEALVLSGDTTQAIESYQKVLELDSANEHATEQLALLLPETKD